MKIETLLHDEIAMEFEGLRTIEMGTNEYKNTVDGLTKLVDRAIEIDKLDIEREEKCKNREFDRDIKLILMNDERKDRIVKNIIAGISVGSGIVLTVWGTLKSLKFEETGTITTSAGRSFINKTISSFLKK